MLQSSSKSLDFDLQAWFFKVFETCSKASKPPNFVVFLGLEIVPLLYGPFMAHLGAKWAISRLTACWALSVQARAQCYAQRGYLTLSEGLHVSVFLLLLLCELLPDSIF